MEFFESGFEQSGDNAPAREYEVLPEGEHQLEIVGASVGTVTWKACEANPEGQCLRLRLSAGRGFAFVFVDIPRERKWVFKALAAALGLEPGPAGKVTFVPPEQLIGRPVRVESGRYTTRGGETRANVKRWLPAIPPPSTATPASTTSRPRATAKAAPCRTQAAKAAAAFRATAGDDDIPF